MSIATAAIVITSIIALFQIALSMRFLEILKEENREEFDRMRGRRDKVLLLMNPLLVGSAYTDPMLYELWGLSEEARALGRKLKAVTILMYIALLGCGVAVGVQYL